MAKSRNKDFPLSNPSNPMKNKRKDIPLAPTPDPGNRKTLTKKEYKEQKKQARWQSNIDQAREGTLADRRIERAAKIGSAVGDAIATATGVGAIANAIKSRRNR
jgi:hypothetical protein